MSANDTQIAGNHYRTSFQHWDFTYRFGYDTYQYIISKYVTRWKRKNGREDLKKARHAMDKYLEVVTKMQKECTPLPVKPKHEVLEVIRFCYANDLDTYQASIISHLTGWEYYQEQDFLKSASNILNAYIDHIETEELARYERDKEAAEEAQCSPPPPSMNAGYGTKSIGWADFTEEEREEEREDHRIAMSRMREEKWAGH